MIGEESAKRFDAQPQLAALLKFNEWFHYLPRLLELKLFAFVNLWQIQ